MSLPPLMIVDREKVYDIESRMYTIEMDDIRKDNIYYTHLHWQHNLDPDAFNAQDHAQFRDGIISDNFSYHDMLVQWEDSKSLLQKMTSEQLPAKMVVDDRLEDIQHRMSNPALTILNVHILSKLICNFMYRSGLDWPHELPRAKVDTKMFQFLQLVWGQYKIPANRDETWAIIPEIGRDFFHALDTGYAFRDIDNIGDELLRTHKNRLFSNKCRQYEDEGECESR